jgi:VWFA-related protein
MREPVGRPRILGPEVMMGATRMASVLVALAALVSTPSPAEPQPTSLSGTAAQPTPPVFGVDVRLVAVPVFVTDKDGRAVSGLTAQDFEIEDAGRGVAVSGFLAVDAAVPSGTLPDASPSPRLMAAARRQFLLLFDLTFSSPAGILEARKAALELLENGPQPGDLVAAAKFGPGGVEVLVGFTPDRAEVARAVATMGSAEGARLRDPLGLTYDLGFAPNDAPGKRGLEIEGNTKAPDFYRDMVILLARSERSAYRQRVVSYVEEFQRLAQLLDSVQGRKQVILLSGGFDQTVLTGAEGTEQADASRAVVEGRLWEVDTDRRFGDANPRMGVLLPPVLMEDPGRWVGLEMSRNERAGSRAFPFQVGGTHFLPRASLETQPGASEKLVLLAYEPSLPGDPAAPLQIRSSLRDREGRLVPPGFLRIEKVHRGGPGRRTYMLGYVSDPLAAGDYTRRIGIGESGSHLEAYSLLRVRPRS